MIKDDYPQFAGFVDIGSCVLHVVHNAFGKDCFSFPLLKDIWQGSRSALLGSPCYFQE